MNYAFIGKQESRPSRSILALILVFVSINFYPALPARAGDGSGDTVISTGDAESGVAAGNEVNQNSTTITPADPADSGGGTTDNNTGDTEAQDSTTGDDTGDSGTDQDSSETEVNDDPGVQTTESGSQTGDLDADLTVENDTNIASNTNSAEIGNTNTASSTSGDNAIASSSGDSLIDTGKATTTSFIGNDVNGNQTIIDCPDCETASGTPATTTIAVRNDNTASTTNTVRLDAQTGTNTIASTSGDAAIRTGDIGIINVIINFINTNIFGRGTQYFLNLWNRINDTIDLSGFGGAYEDNTAKGGACEVNECYVSINNQNTGEIVNDVVIKADSGSNTIESAANGVIETGDINITNDILNIANLNITGNDWFFAVVNVFDELRGDILLPGIEPDSGSTTKIKLPDQEKTQGESRQEGKKEPLTERIAREGKASSEVVITNANNAAVINQIETIADTGNNDIASGSEAVIQTGAADVRSTVFNMINYNIYGNSWKFARVNIFGNWRGFVNGLPEGYSYMEDGLGITVYNDILDDPALNEQFALLLLDNDNQATTTNKVKIEANSGNNSILHAGEGGGISTGGINIYNSLLNFINSNFTGDNWEFSMVNVFGDWQGDLSFGQPELWVTESIKRPSEIGPHSRLTYTFLFGNQGDAAAKSVYLIDDFDENLLRVDDGSGGENQSGEMIWLLGDLPPNSQGSLSYTVEVRGDIPHGKSHADNSAFILGQGGDRDESNNSTGGRVTVDGGTPRQRSNDFQAAAGSGGFSALSVIKTNNASTTLNPGDTVDFRIKVKNNGTLPAEEVYVLDTMTDIDGRFEINRSFWDLATIESGEEVVIDYTLEISPGIESGTYLNQVMVEGLDPYQGGYYTVVATSKIKVENDSSDGGPNLAIGFLPQQSLINPGDTAEFSFQLTNNGSAQAVNVYVEETLAEGLTYYGEDGKTVKRWDLDNYNPGYIEKHFYSLLVDENLEPGEYFNTIKVWADNKPAYYTQHKIVVTGPTVRGAEYGVGGPDSLLGQGGGAAAAGFSGRGAANDSSGSGSGNPLIPAVLAESEPASALSGQAEPISTQLDQAYRPESRGVPGPAALETETIIGYGLALLFMLMILLSVRMFHRRNSENE